MGIKSAYIVISLSLLLAFASFFGDQSFSELKRLESELEAKQLVQVSLKNDVRDLKQNVWNIIHDPNTLENLARNEYALVKDKEVVVFFNDQNQ